jgi:Transposase zinc-binding domain
VSCSLGGPPRDFSMGTPTALGNLNESSRQTFATKSANSGPGTGVPETGSGARGYLPRPRGRLASCQPRSREPRPTQGDERHRELPHGGPRRPSAGTWHAARTAPTRRSPTTAIATGTAPKCQGAAAREWMAAREAELLPVSYFHVVFTPPMRNGRASPLSSIDTIAQPVRQTATRNDQTGGLARAPQRSRACRHTQSALPHIGDRDVDRLGAITADNP